MNGSVGFCRQWDDTMKSFIFGAWTPMNKNHSPVHMNTKKKASGRFINFILM